MCTFCKRALAIVIGSVFIAIGLNGFLIPFGLLDGGALGISLIFHYLMGVKVGLTFLTRKYSDFYGSLDFLSSFLL